MVFPDTRWLARPRSQATARDVTAERGLHQHGRQHDLDSDGANIDGAVELALRRRQGSRPERRASRYAAAIVGGGFVSFAIVCAALGGSLTTRQAAIGAALSLLYFVAFRTQFESAAGSAVPTEPVLVGMCLLIPVQFVPLALLLVIAFDFRAGPIPWPLKIHEFLVRATSGAHVVGPVLVLWIAGSQEVRVDRWPLLVCALLAQFVSDALFGAIRCAGLGMPVRSLARPMGWTFAIDALLAPIGVCLVASAGNDGVAIALLCTPVALVWLLSLDRREQVETAVRLGEVVESVRGEARVDAMTRLANRRSWDEAIVDASFVLDKDQSLRATVLLVDMDELKLANDTLGHEVGDHLIQAMAAVLVSTFSPAHSIARLGGDEFALLFVGTADQFVAAEVEEAAHRAIDAHPLVYGCALRGSVGAAQCPPAASLSAALRLADDKMFAEKRRRKTSRLAGNA
jgi:diguanylate cyclase (GGDEF)-like protein